MNNIYVFRNAAGAPELDVRTGGTRDTYSNKSQHSNHSVRVFF